LRSADESCTKDDVFHHTFVDDALPQIREQAIAAQVNRRHPKVRAEEAELFKVKAVDACEYTTQGETE
jgi:hypothetical protein